MTMMPVIVDVIAGGVAARYPALKFGFFESNPTIRTPTRNFRTPWTPS